MQAIKTIQTRVANFDPLYVKMLKWEQKGDIVKAKPKFYLGDMAFKYIRKAFKQMGGKYVYWHGQAYFEAVIKNA